MLEISALEAKDRLGHLLEQVEHGEEVRITRDGKEVARLVPAKGTIDRPAAREAARAIREMSKGVTLGGLNPKELINQGRV